MDEPRSIIWPILRGVCALAAALAAALWVLVAIQFIGGYLSPDSGDSPGHIGHLFVALFFLVLAGPFGALAFVLAAPLISKNPKYRNAEIPTIDQQD